MARSTKVSVLFVVLLALLSMPRAVVLAQSRSGIESYLAPGYPFELVSARKTDRIAWLVFERGMRNVYTAAAPSFTPVRVTRHLADDGVDLTDLRISDDGSTVVFVRGHAPNRSGWVANPLSNPAGATRTIWAARIAGGAAWQVAEGGEPALSPDGRAVLYVKDGQIHRAPVAQTASGSPPDRAEQPLITAWGENGDPVWSPDGSKIAFVSDRNDHTLIGVYDTVTKKVSWVSPSVDHDTSPAWSADGTQLAFIRRPGTPFGLQSQPGTGGIGNPPGPAANRQGRSGNQPPRESTVPGLTRATFRGGYTFSIHVAAIPGSLQREDGSIETAAREVWHSPPNDEGFARVNRLEFARDHVVFQAEPEEWSRYYSVPVSGTTGAPMTLTPGDGMVETASLSSDGAYLFYGTNAGDIDRRHVWKVPVGGGTAVQLTRGSEIENYPVVLSSGKHVAMLTAAAARPQSVAVASPEEGATPRVIFPTLEASFPAAAHVTPQNVTLTADDGVKFNNQLFVPRGLGAGEKRPAIVFVHGGPSRQMLLGYPYMHFYHMAYAVNQWFAHQGYVVLSVNYRRGIGYGRSFRTAPNTGGQGNAEYKDVLAAGKYLQTRADVDPNRIGIWGLSYGGVLTAQALARNSDLFKAGVDLAGVHLWGNSIEPDAVSFQSSAIGAIATWKSPVLLLHGDDDRNVAFAQTTGLVQLLRAHDVEHELIVFPDDVHDSLLHKRWVYTFERASEFLGRHLGWPRSTTTQ
jgi:dipeptidyl aminopeptidase/acylaminoacyl peptidase